MHCLTDNGLRRAALGVALLLAGTGAAHAANFSANLTATPASYSGECPATIAFKGVIKTDKPGNVQYKFVRSDGAFAPIHTIDFAAAGAKEVTTTWKLGGASLPSYSGWQAIQIVYPTSLQSNKATFTISCKSAKPAASAATAVKATVPVAVRKPEITGYKHPGECVAKGRELTILGKHLGNQTGKSAALGGHGIHVDLTVRMWSDNRIDVTLPHDARIADGQWYYIGIEKADHTGWLSNINKNITMCKSTPVAMSAATAVSAAAAVIRPVITGYRHPGACVAKGRDFTILGRHFGERNGKRVQLGGHGIGVELPVRSWSDTQIVVGLPNDARVANGQWYYTGIRNRENNRWLSNISENLTVCRS